MNSPVAFEPTAGRFARAFSVILSGAVSLGLFAAVAGGMTARSGGHPLGDFVIAQMQAKAKAVALAPVRGQRRAG